jgi:hypothetical protein
MSLEHTATDSVCFILTAKGEHGQRGDNERLTRRIEGF